MLHTQILKFINTPNIQSKQSSVSGECTLQLKQSRKDYSCSLLAHSNTTPHRLSVNPSSDFIFNPGSSSISSLHPSNDVIQHVVSALVHLTGRHVVALHDASWHTHRHTVCGDVHIHNGACTHFGASAYADRTQHSDASPQKDAISCGTQSESLNLD